MCIFRNSRYEFNDNQNKKINRNIYQTCKSFVIIGWRERFLFFINTLRYIVVGWPLNWFFLYENHWKKIVIKLCSFFLFHFITTLFCTCCIDSSLLQCDILWNWSNLILIFSERKNLKEDKKRREKKIKTKTK